MRFSLPYTLAIIISCLTWLTISSHTFANPDFSSTFANTAIDVNLEGQKLKSIKPTSQGSELKSETDTESESEFNDIYKIELLVFAYVNTGDENSEIWRNPNLPDFSYHLQFAESEALNKAEIEEADNTNELGEPEENNDTNDYISKNEREFLNVEDENITSFKDIKRKMAINGHYRILKHLAWEQKVLDQDAMDFLYLQGGENVSVHTTSDSPSRNSLNSDSLSQNNANESLALNTKPELQGTIQIYRSRYLHIIPDLYFTEFALNDAGICPASENQENSTSNAPALLNIEQSAEYPSYTALTNFVINQKRRLKNGELHYLDHPRFGFLIKFNKVEIPETNAEPDSEEAEQI